MTKYKVRMSIDEKEYFWVIIENNKTINRNADRELGKKFDILILYCISEDGNAIDRIYIFPKEEIADITGISITEHPTDNVGDAKIGWYEEYRTGEDDLKEANKIWKN